ncbi:seipin-1 isoform X1 [Arachis hypogaea]|uniref:seipin-1 isoform X1 n=1 Tax=Arachis hypogaea TaxID=3818 RepID=UPI000DECA0BC|nr:seipin-1 isoform X1 [Arachis hypogaea]
MEENQKPFLLLPKPYNFVSKLVNFHADLIYNCIVCIFSPFYSLLSFASEFFHQETKYTAVESSELHQQAHHGGGTTTTTTTTTTTITGLFFKKLGLGLLSAAYLCIVLFLVLIVATVLGVCLVKLWVEEPVVVRENVHFDYTEENPSAVFSFDGGMSGFVGRTKRNKHISVPVGHMFHVSLLLVMPESDFNTQLGVFQLLLFVVQLTAELLTGNGNVIAKSSRPSMLRFRSSPIRLARTLMMGLPLVLGVSDETQSIIVDILRHKEEYRRTKAIRVTMHPRSGTSSLPQLYEAQIMIKSRLPWSKEVVRNWKWTFYVWVSIYVYIVLLMFLLCCYRRLLFLVTPDLFGRGGELPREEPPREHDESEISELLRKLRRRRRNKRKAISDHDDDGDGVEETIVGSSGETINTEDVTGSVPVEQVDEDSGSVCF